MNLIVKTINTLCDKGLISELPFVVTDTLRAEYVRGYAKLSGSNVNKLGSSSNKKYALKLAGLNLHKYGGDSSAGFIYCIANPSFPLHVKVGITNNIKIRLSQYQTYDPYRAYYIVCYRFVENKKEIEKYILSKFKVDIDRGEWVSNLDVINYIKALK